MDFKDTLHNLELEGFYIVKSIIRQVIDASHIEMLNHTLRFS